MSGRRQAAERRGRTAELIAALYLMCKGYRILGQRLRTPFGEVDLAALKNGVLVMVEVKARSSMELGANAISPRSQDRIMRAGVVLAGRWRLTNAPMRYDLIVVGVSLLPRHERGAFWEGSAERTIPYR